MHVKPLAWNEIRKNAAAFVNEWAGETYEKGESQSFWSDLFAVYGVRRRNVAKFEAQARRIAGGTGFIDVFWPGMMIAEQKTTGKDLDAAEAQAMDYLTTVSDAEMPRYVVTCDFSTFRVRDLEAPAGEESATFALEDFPTECERLGFIAGYQKRSFGSEEQAAASVKAAQLMASLYEELEKSGYDEHQSSIFLVRTLFALFADDSGLWERDLFLEYLETRTSPDGSDLGAALAVLYQALNKPAEKRLSKADELIQRFPYVNGSVFGETIEIPYFDKAMRDKLIAACFFNWGEISPAIFGSLFQAVKSRDARRALGEHYTTETNILKVIEPLFLDELRQRFIDNQHNVRGLRKLQQDIGQLRFLDPACGCGNFLIVAYREMRNLELKILKRLQELDPSSAQMVLDASQLLQVRMTSFYGIELEEWPATIAQTAMFLVDHQANQDMALALGLAPDMLPLVDSSHILVGNALQTEWSQLLPASENVCIFGNPPFLGHATRNEGQAAELRQVWVRDDIGRLDYVTGWYKKAIDYFGDIPGRWAFVSTNSIVQGEPVPALFGPVFSAGWRIRFAHRTFAWTSEAPGAAAVHCVVIGFDRAVKPLARLFSYSELRGRPAEEPAKTINGYLVDGPSVLVEQRRKPLSPMLPPFVFGNMPRGADLIVEPEDYDGVMADPVAAKYVRPFVMGRELIHNAPRWCLWLVDLDPADVPRSPVLRQRIESVRRFRLASSAASTRAMAATPHLFGQRSQPDASYIGVPAVFSENRPYATAAHFSPEVIAGNKIFTATDPDGFVFAIFSSSMFITWQKTVGGRLKSDPNFSNTLVWNNLPLPAVGEATQQKIIDAGHGVLDARTLHPERSLAHHYSPLAMDPQLVKAHDKLDGVVDRAFGAKGSCASEKQRQEILFARYAELAADEYRTVSK
ncbi:class I SAM-dependent DNA methyltransferase [Kocuria rosea]|uniref:class I SAM-dependent DNA methyltransferase n=1 Tax=Kocuria rosea TaxID=1275 RepID=UPI00232F757A|nr:DNA methyltransferase [Kocuria rosea]